MESKKGIAQCLLGHGECPQACDLHEVSKSIAKRLGYNFDSVESRRRIVSAEGTRPNISVTGLSARIIAGCLKENNIVEG